ncbi:MAG: hypothetical protein ACP59X_09020 [Solidesulfovibrio sp. DCME]|uniref:hypothetical protein n=1 Tax=Solidesulfovibrio sp. DCME TaxID=3447380 RepID=UPI003D0E4745
MSGERGGRRMWRRLAVGGLAALALGFVLASLGCSEDPPAGDRETLTGKTPVVRPEDVHGRGAGGAAVLAPDYRQDLSASLEAGPAGGANRAAGPPLSDPAAGRLFAGRTAANTVQAASPSPVVPPASPAAAPSAPAAGPSPSAPLAPALFGPGQAPGQTAPAGAGAATAPGQTARPGPVVASASPPSPDKAPSAESPWPTAAPGGGAATQSFPVAACRQLVLVVARDFAADSGELRRFERTGPGAPWRQAGPVVACRLGRNGLGVGRGLVPLADGPVKRQGDGRSPAGLFALPEAFGYAGEEAAKGAGVRLPYVALTDRAACVTEAASPLFGRVVGPGERGAGGAAGQERMVRDDRANVWGVVIAHNRDQPDPQAGACLFLNVRQASGPATGGSIGCPEEAVAALAAWLDPAAAPVLAVLPEAVYSRERQAWGLP